VAKHAVAGDIDGVKKTRIRGGSGEWNRVESRRKAELHGWVNGQKVNEAAGVELQKGPVGLQSEGGESLPSGGDHPAP